MDKVCEVFKSYLVKIILSLIICRTKKANINPVKQDLSAKIGDFTDFYSYQNHIDNCEKLNPQIIKSNYECVPIAYHERHSSVKFHEILYLICRTIFSS